MWGSAARARRPLLGALAIVAALVASSLLSAAPVASVAGPSAEIAAANGSLAPRDGPLVLAADAPSDAVAPGSHPLGAPSSAPLDVLLTLTLSNQSALNALLSQLSDRDSPQYHQYLTGAQFDARFSPSTSAWETVVNYLAGFSITNLTTTPDRVSVAFDATPAVADGIFHTSIERFDAPGEEYEAPASPAELPSGVADFVAQVEGLSTLSADTTRIATGEVTVGARDPTAPAARSVPLSLSGYLTPASYHSFQMEYASDIQVADDEESLFQEYGYPTNASVATILWGGSYDRPTKSTPCGSLTQGQLLGPYVPSDVSDFFNETLPAGQPHPSVTAVPIDGAVGPGCLASYDTSGAVAENTIDLEMVGSTAPGAHLYDVYGSVASTADLDQALATILSPPATLPTSVRLGLENVSVISNSWTAVDENDTSWYESLEQAQARGVSVLASSGDSGDNPASAKYDGSIAEFPGTMAYDTFGTTAVGGTTVVLNNTTLQLQSQVVWNVTAAFGATNGPGGSTGGISTVFPEPSWQLDSAANSLIEGLGRGVPDIATVANNTLVTLTVDGVEYVATNASVGGAFTWAQGTSVACPLEAGIVAEVDHVLASVDDPPLGFMNPVLYSVANAQYAALPSGQSGIVAHATGSYHYSLPTEPFRDVVNGSNDVYSAAPGYDLVTGWGSMDAYNYTMYVLSNSSDRVAGHLSGVRDVLNLTGLDAVATDGIVSVSLQQNLFLANGLGAPVYGVQNLVEVSGTPDAWTMNFTGSVVFPFVATYPAWTVDEQNLTVARLAEQLPLQFNLTTVLSAPGTLAAAVTLSFGVPGTGSISLPVPGAAFMLGSQNYSYSWQGATYSNGGPAVSPGEGFLAPQFGLVAGPGPGVAAFLAPTDGNLTAWVEPWGSPAFLPALTQVFGPAVSQTPEEALNLQFNQTGGNDWSVGVEAGNDSQGILAFEPPLPPVYRVEFLQIGVPAATTWWVNVTGGADLSAPGATSELDLELENGSYPWTFAVGLSYGVRSASGGTAVVDGSGVTQNLTFTIPNGTVTFLSAGLPPGDQWGVTISGAPPVAGNTSDLVTTLPYGIYNYSFTAPDPTWRAVPAVGGFFLRSPAIGVTVSFHRVLFSVTLVPEFVGTAAVAWSISVGGAEFNGSGSRETIGLPNGSYEYEISVPRGYSVQPAAGYFGIIASPFTLVFTVTLPPSGPWGLGATGYAIVAAIIVGPIAAVLVLVDRRRRRRHRAHAPPTPTESAPPGGTT